MNRKIYRICLVLLIIAAMTSGVLYYQYCQKQELSPSDGTLVWRVQSGSEDV